MARKVVVVDNYDSFTYLLVDYLTALGAACEVVLNDAVSAGEIAAMRPSAVLLSPGPAAPRDAGNTLEVIRTLAGRVPLLGVCLGHQAIAAHFGARIRPAPRPMHGKTSDILHDGAGLFRGLPSPLTVGRYHSLIVEPNELASCLAVSATTAEQELMGLRHRDLPIEGVQFHPESLLTAPFGMQMMANWLEQW